MNITEKIDNYLIEKTPAWTDKDGTKYYEGDKVMWGKDKGTIVASDAIQAYVFRKDGDTTGKHDRRLSGAKLSPKGYLKKI